MEAANTGVPSRIRETSLEEHPRPSHGVIFWKTDPAGSALELSLESSPGQKGIEQLLELHSRHRRNCTTAFHLTGRVVSHRHLVAGTRSVLPTGGHQGT